MKLHRPEVLEASDFRLSEMFRLNSETESFLRRRLENNGKYYSLLSTRNFLYNGGR